MITTQATGERLRLRARRSLENARKRGDFPTVRRSTFRTLDLLPIEQPFTAAYLADISGIAVTGAREELEVLAYALERYAKGVLRLQRESPRRHRARGGKPAFIFRLTLAPRVK